MLVTLKVERKRAGGRGRACVLELEILVGVARAPIRDGLIVLQVPFDNDGVFDRRIDDLLVAIVLTAEKRRRTSEIRPSARQLRFATRQPLANARFRRSFEFEALVRPVLLVDIGALIIDVAAVAKHCSALTALLDPHLRAMNREIELTTVGTDVECLAVSPHDGLGLVFPSAVLTVPRRRVELHPCRIAKRADMNHDDSAAVVHERLGRNLDERPGLRPMEVVDVEHVIGCRLGQLLQPPEVAGAQAVDVLSAGIPLDSPAALIALQLIEAGVAVPIDAL